MHLQSFNTSWDSYFANQYALKSISLDKVNAFIVKSDTFREVPLKDDPLTVLHKFELISEEQITNACHLLFAHGDVFNATTELGRFASPTSIKDGITVRSDLFSQVEDILNFIKKHINKEYIITGNPQREEKWEYPLNALREVVVNMVVHRDYMHHGDSSVQIFDNHIEFFNPGPLPDSISLEQLITENYISQARNKKIASIFKESGIIEKYGSGIKRIQQSFSESGLPAPFFENFQHGFRVILFSSTVEKTVEKTESRILNLIKTNPEITIKQLGLETGLSRRGVEWQLQKLKEKNMIKRKGPDKGGYWEINK